MPIPKTPANLRASGPRGTAYDQILDAIVRGDLAPGERLYDEDLEARFGTTRSAIRAALAELETQWLVRIVPRKGTFVTDLDLNRGYQAAEVLAGVTTRAMHDSAGRLEPQHLSRLADYRDRWLRDAGTVREAMVTAEGHHGLYDVFFDVSGNPELVRVRDWVLPYVKRVRSHLVQEGSSDPAAVLTMQRYFVASVTRGDVGEAASHLWESTGMLFGEFSPGLLRLDPPKPGVTLTRDIAADTIERAILDGTLLPDEPLPEVELMAWLGVSHTPVRQALDELANRGLVEQQLNKSARVARLNPETIRDTFAAYGVLIRVAYRRAMQLDRDELRAVLRHHQDRYRSEPQTPVHQINVGLNVALFEFSGAQLLLELSERLASRLTWYVIGEDDAVARPRALRLSAETQAAVAANDWPAMNRIIWERFEKAYWPGSVYEGTFWPALTT